MPSGTNADASDVHTMSLLHALRTRTQAQHARLEAMLRLERPDLTLIVYRALLQRLHALYGALEQGGLGHPGIADHADQLAAAGLLWSPRRKLPWLVADLAVLGIDPLPASAQPAGRVRLARLAQVFGCLYVLEGATLGGRIISRNVAACLGLETRTGAAFFTSYGQSTGSMWQQFRRALVGRIWVPDERHDAIEAAVQTFELFVAFLGDLNCRP